MFGSSRSELGVRESEKGNLLPSIHLISCQSYEIEHLEPIKPILKQVQDDIVQDDIVQDDIVQDDGELKN